MATGGGAPKFAMSAKPPKVVQLRRNETLSSFLAWKGNLTYNLALNPHFAPFLEDDIQWQPKSVSRTRGLQNIIEMGTRRTIETATQRAKFLDTMLGMIAGYAPIISRNIITRDCCSMNQIFHKIRAHYGFAQTGSNIIDAVSICQGEEESPEDVFQRLHSLIDTSLLTSEGRIRHMGNFIQEDEEVTPTLSNIITCIWLKAIHPGLPSLVKLKYATQLKNCTIASIREEISSSIPELLAELNDQDGSSANVYQTSASFRSFNPNNRFRQPGNGSKPNNFRPSTYQNRRQNTQFQRRQSPSCPVCKQAGRRNFDHFLSSCSFLPEEDRRFVTRARLIESLDEENYDSAFNNFSEDLNHSLPYHPYQPDQNEYSQSTQQVTTPETAQNQCMRVTTEPSPFINAFYNNHSVKILLDTGATVNLINESLANFLRLPISPSSQTAKQADGISDLNVKGETRFSLSRNNLTLHFEGLIVCGLESEILAGIPFMSANVISIFPSKNEIMIGDRKVAYDTPHRYRRQAQCRNVFSAPVVCNSPVTLFPSEFVDIACNNTQIDGTVFVEPFNDWMSPRIHHSVDGKIRLTNSSPVPVTLESDQVIAASTTISDVYLQDPSSENESTKGIVQSVPLVNPTETQSVIPSPLEASNPVSTNLSKIKFNPQNQSIDKAWKPKFNKLHLEHASIFYDNLPGYNGKFGSIFAYVNIGDSLPPQRRGKIPQYSRNNLIELQKMIDQFEEQGVFATPEAANTYAEYMNPTFLVKKPGSDSLRLVTSFGEVAAHSKPTPTLASNIDEVLREFGRWKFIIKTDLKKAYYQIPLHEDSRKYCAIVSPFKGVRVYCRAAMGMPGSECALDELMSRMFGDLIEKGDVKRVADDIYAGASDIESLYAIWKIVLDRLHQACLRLTPGKTEILPSETVILGWIWCEGKLTPSPHHTSALSVCDRPKNVKALRSYLGAYKVISRCLKHCSQFIAPLESLSAGKESSDLIVWDDSSIDVFTSSQQHLKECAAISIPSPPDKLWLVTDASSANSGIAATLLSTSSIDSTPKICSFFSAKLKGGHNKWLPCEIECLAIASAINHFRPFILNAEHRVTVLTDSKPAVQAYQKFLRGEFSTSSRMQAFLLAATQNNVVISHISGVSNSLADFGSRNSLPCNHPSCSICRFIEESEMAGVNSVSVKDIISGSCKVPFNSAPAWLQIQLNCPAIQLARKHIQQGTRPMKSQTNIRNIKQLLRIASVKDDLLVVQKKGPLQPSRNLIVIPEQYAPGLITALHLQLNHPSAYQLQKVFDRQFYTINSDRLIKESVESCHQCRSLHSLPKESIPHSTSAPYNHVGSNYSADIVKRNQQKILVMNEEVTNYTLATFIDSEQHSSILRGIKELVYQVHPPCSPTAYIKVDPAPGMQTLYRLQPLQSRNILFELGEPKNKNKLATIDKRIQELENEFVRVGNRNSKLMKDDLAMAVSALNSRIRSCGLSSYEQWVRRDQFSRSEISIQDKDLINLQHGRRELINAKTDVPSTLEFKVGDLVYIINEKTKHTSRPRYIVDSVVSNWLYLRKLTDTQLKAKTYKIHRSACTKVLSTIPISQGAYISDSDSDSSLDDISAPGPASSEDTPVVSDPITSMSDLQSHDTPEDYENNLASSSNTTRSPAAESALETPITMPGNQSEDSPSQATEPVTADPVTTSGRPRRNRRPPIRLGDYVLELEE